MAQQTLGDNWSEIFHAGKHDGETYTRADLDKMVSEYNARDEAGKAPVGLGTAAEQRPETIGKIDALRRSGDSLEGKFTNVDPRAEYLFGRGAFPKRSTAIKRSPDDISLQRVGLIHPMFDTSWDNGKTPSLDELMKGSTAMKDHMFSDRGGVSDKYAVFTGPFTQSEPAANAAIARLKAHGYWSDRCEQAGLAVLFHECPNLIDPLSRLLKVVMNHGDPTSPLLSERASYWAKTHGVSFGEALSQVTQDPGQWLTPKNFSQSPEDFKRNKQADLENSKRALAGGLITQQMFDLAWKYANADHITFKLGMVRVEGEHPEWFSALAQKQVADLWNPAG